MSFGVVKIDNHNKRVSMVSECWIQYEKDNKIVRWPKLCGLKLIDAMKRSEIPGATNTIAGESGNTQTDQILKDVSHIKECLEKMNQTNELCKPVK